MVHFLWKKITKSILSIFSEICSKEYYRHVILSISTGSECKKASVDIISDREIISILFYYIPQKENVNWNVELISAKLFNSMFSSLHGFPSSITARGLSAVNVWMSGKHKWNGNRTKKIATHHWLFLVKLILMISMHFKSLFTHTWMKHEDWRHVEEKLPCLTWFINKKEYGFICEWDLKLEPVYFGTIDSVMMMLCVYRTFF